MELLLKGIIGGGRKTRAFTCQDRKWIDQSQRLFHSPLGGVRLGSALLMMDLGRAAIADLCRLRPVTEPVIWQGISCRRRTVYCYECQALDMRLTPGRSSCQQVRFAPPVNKKSPDLPSSESGACLVPFLTSNNPCFFIHRKVPFFRSLNFFVHFLPPPPFRLESFALFQPVFRHLNIKLNQPGNTMC